MQGLYLAEWVTKRRDNWLTAEGNLIYFTLHALEGAGLSGASICIIPSIKCVLRRPCSNRGDF